MPNKILNNLDDFAAFVGRNINPWSMEKRIVLAAAMAERWLPVYEAFSDKEDWGNSATLENAVQIVWDCALNRHQFTAKEMKAQHERLRKDTPHVDDFDCEDALAACGILGVALNCCEHGGNTELIIEAMTYGLWGVAPDPSSDPEELPPDFFQKRKVQNEIEKQLKLIEVIGNMDQIDQQQIDALRKKLTARDLRGPVAPRPKSGKGPTNKAIFERYRKATETDLKRKLPWSDSSPLGNVANPIMFSLWGGRYLRRKYLIEKLCDVAARDALVRKNSTHDAAVQGDPDWDYMLSFSIRVSYPHPDNGYDAKSPEEPHSYGPSFRRLCIEGGWAGAMKWTKHVPPAWEEEDRRKKEGQPPELTKNLTRKLSWRTTDDVDHPWSTEAGEDTWRVRLNDFPDEIMYTLIVNDEVIGNFHDWPKTWLRDGE